MAWTGANAAVAGCSPPVPAGTGPRRWRSWSPSRSRPAAGRCGPRWPGCSPPCTGPRPPWPAPGSAALRWLRPSQPGRPPTPPARACRPPRHCSHRRWPTAPAPRFPRWPGCPGFPARPGGPRPRGAGGPARPEPTGARPRAGWRRRPGQPPPPRCRRQQPAPGRASLAVAREVPQRPVLGRPLRLAGFRQRPRLMRQGRGRRAKVEGRRRQRGRGRPEVRLRRRRGRRRRVIRVTLVGQRIRTQLLVLVRRRLPRVMVLPGRGQAEVPVTHRAPLVMIRRQMTRITRGRGSVTPSALRSGAAVPGRRTCGTGPRPGFGCPHSSACRCSGSRAGRDDA